MPGKTRRIVFTEECAPPGGAYSQAVIAGDTIYLSGQVGRDVNGVLLEGVEAQADQCLKNIEAVLKAAGNGTDMSNVVKMTVLLDDINDFQKVNTVYQKYFPTRPPSRAAYAAKGLPMGALVEMEGVAIFGPIDEK